MSTSTPVPVKLTFTPSYSNGSVHVKITSTVKEFPRRSVAFTFRGAPLEPNADGSVHSLKIALHAGRYEIQRVLSAIDASEWEVEDNSDNGLLVLEVDNRPLTSFALFGCLALFFLIVVGAFLSTTEIPWTREAILRRRAKLHFKELEMAAANQVLTRASRIRQSLRAASDRASSEFDEITRLSQQRIGETVSRQGTVNPTKQAANATASHVSSRPTVLRSSVVPLPFSSQIAGAARSHASQVAAMAKTVMSPPTAHSSQASSLARATAQGPVQGLVSRIQQHSGTHIRS